MNSITLAREFNLCTDRTHERGVFGPLALPLTEGVKDRLKQHLYTYAFKVMQGNEELYSERQNAADMIFDTAYLLASRKPQSPITSLFWMARKGSADFFLPLTTYWAMKIKGALIVPAVIFAVIIDIVTILIRLLTSLHFLCCQREHPLKKLLIEQHPGIEVGDRVTVYMTGWNTRADGLVEEECMAFEVNFTSTPRDAEKYDRIVSDPEPRSSDKYVTLKEKFARVVSEIKEKERVKQENLDRFNRVVSEIKEKGRIKQEKELARQAIEIRQMEQEDRLSQIEQKKDELKRRNEAIEEMERQHQEVHRMLAESERKNQQEFEEKQRAFEANQRAYEETQRRSQATLNSLFGFVTPGRQEGLAVLGLSEGATDKQIKTRYRELAAENHPDKLKQLNKPADPEKWQEIQDAYDLLVPKPKQS